MKPLELLSVIFLFLITSSFATGDVVLKKDEPKPEKIAISVKDAVSFAVDAEVGPISLTVEGKGADLNGNVELVGDLATGQFVVDVTQFKTGQDSRDEHLQLALESGKYKLAYLGVKDVKVMEGEYPFKGTLKLHGVEKPVTGVIKQKKKSVNAVMVINRKDFGIEIPASIMTKLGASVDEKVKVEVKFSY